MLLSIYSKLEARKTVRSFKVEEIGRVSEVTGVSTGEIKRVLSELR